MKSNREPSVFSGRGEEIRKVAPLRPVKSYARKLVTV